MLTSSITKAIIEKCDNDTKKEDNYGDKARQVPE
mgnify:CR=1 FL=1